MKPYPPVMREKRRYILCKIDAQQPITKKEAIKALWDNAFEFLGVIGAAEASFWVMDFDEKKQEAILRVNNKNVDRVLGILAFFDEVSNKKACIHIIKISGTIRKTRKSSEP